MAAGYSISIKALDEASAQIARINKALKDLERADQSADQAISERTRKNKGLFDQLNRGVSDFSKNAKSELFALSKHFTEVGGKIGMTINALGKAFDLKGAGIGLAIGVGAAVKIEQSLQRAARETRDMVNMAARLDISSGALQKVQALNRRYNINDQSTTGMMTHIQEVSRLASRGQNNLVLQYFRTHGMENFQSMSSDQIYMKMLGNLQSLKPGDSKSKAEWLDVMRQITGSEEPMAIVTRGSAKLAENLEDVNKHFVTLDKEATTAFDNLAEKTTGLGERMHSVWNVMLNTFGTPLANLLSGAEGVLDSFFEKLESHPIIATAGAAGAAAVAYRVAVSVVTSILGRFIPGLAGRAGMGIIGRMMSNPIGLGIAAGTGAAIGVGVEAGNRAANDDYSFNGIDANIDPFGMMKHATPGGATPGAGAAPPNPSAPSTGAPGAAAVPTGAPNPNAGSNEAMIRSAIRSAGGNAMAEAGLLSNFDYESGGLKTGATNPGSGHATGWAQWIGSRKRGLIAFAQQHGLDPASPQAQQGFLNWELTHDYKGVIARMNAAKTPQEAAEIGLRYYEGINESNAVLAGARSWEQMRSTHIAKASKYYQPDPIMPAGSPTPAVAPQASGNQSSHEVNVSFNNLPSGARVGIGNTSGDADLNFRTRYAMAPV